MTMKRNASYLSVLVAVAVLAARVPGPAFGLEITAFNSNGELSWDDPGATGTNNYAVEWARSRSPEPHTIQRPPSIRMVWPVTKRASALAR